MRAHNGARTQNTLSEIKKTRKIGCAKTMKYMRPDDEHVACVHRTAQLESANACMYMRACTYVTLFSVWHNVVRLVRDTKATPGNVLFMRNAYEM